MVEGPPTAEPRVAEAVARLLARQATLLARSLEDEAAAGAAKLGLSWLGDLLRSFGLVGASEWFQALRVRADVLGDRTSAAWAGLAAPLCEVLAADVRRAGSLAPLADQAHDWTARVAELTAFAEPPPPAKVPAAAPMPPPVVPPPVAPPPVVPPPTAPVVPPPVARAVPPSEPEPEVDEAHHLLFEVIADFAGEQVPEVDARHGRIEIAGHRPAASDAHAAALADLDRGARAADAVVLAREEGGQLRWIVRLPLLQAMQYLFVERAGIALAIPWHRVVEYGLGPGGPHPRVVIGHGLERRELEVEWLFGKGVGVPASIAGAEPAPPEGYHFAGVVADSEGRAARVLERAQDARGPVVATAPAPPRPPAPKPAAPPPPGPVAHPVQPEAVPADNPRESPVSARPVLRALVADDSMMARVFLGRLLAQRGFEVDEAEDGSQARAALVSVRYDVVFLDAEMPGAGAIEILHDEGERLAARACVLIKDDEERRRVEAFGPVPVLYKPFAEDEVRGAVAALLARLPLGH